MAKVTAPLFSLEASGTIGKTVTYSRWHGRAYARRRVIPLNPQSTEQVEVRNRLRPLAIGMHWASVTAMIESGETLTDEFRLIAVTPSDLAWNSFLIKMGIGADGLTYDAAQAAYVALTGGQQTAWVAAAAALVPAIPQSAQGATGGGFGTPLTAGNVYFKYRYALATALGTALPTGTPPTYA